MASERLSIEKALKFLQFSAGKFLYSLNPAILTIWSPLLLSARESPTLAHTYLAKSSNVSSTKIGGETS